MAPFSRRSFLSAGLGLAASASLGFSRTADDDPPDDTHGQGIFRPATLFLTWHRDPTTTMTIQWVGTRGETSDSNIYFRELNALNAARLIVESATSPLTSFRNASWQAWPTTPKPFPMTDFKVFRAEMTGLVPNTEYEFRIGKHSPTWRFRTMPAKANDAISFISGGDCGINPHAVANNIQAAKQDPMFAVVGGDLGYDNGRSVDISLAFLRNYSHHMVGKRGRLIPMVTCIGNHEVDGGYNKSREKAPFYYALFDGLFPHTGFATLDFGDYLSLVLLDTGHTSPIEGEQTAWLEKTLKARKDHPNVMAVNHVPAYPSFRSMKGVSGKDGTGEGNRKHWTPLFDKYRVPVVLEHHDHTFKRSRPILDGKVNDNGVLYLGDGSWGRLRAPRAPDKLPYLAKTSQDYHLSLHRIQGDERFHLAIDENGRVMDVARTGQRKAGSVRTSG